MCNVTELKGALDLNGDVCDPQSPVCSVSLCCCELLCVSLGSKNGG